MNKYLLCLPALLYCFAFSACSEKDTPPVEEEETVTPVAENMFGKLITVSNFSGGAMTGNPGNEEDQLLYSLEQNKEISLNKIATMQWDISFSNIFKSFLSGNNGSNATNFGYGNKAKGGIMLLEKSFDEVIDIPADHEFATVKEAFGTDENGDFGQGKGWYLYDGSGTLVRDGSYDNQHIAYPLDKPLVIKQSNGNQKTLGARTIVVRTAQGHYAKVRIRSVYKDKIERDTWQRLDPKPFITFDYVLAKAGSSTFDQ